MRPLSDDELRPFDAASSREWLSTNGAGAFASGTVSGASTRRYHALLVAALRPPLGRMALLGRVEESVAVGGARFDLAANRYPDDVVFPEGWRLVESFAPWPVPTWTYRLPDGTVLCKRVFLARSRNTVYVTYTLHDAPRGPATLTLAPLVCWKDYHANMHPWPGFPLHQGPLVGGWFLQATPDAPTLRLLARGASWKAAGWWHERIVHERDRERGQDHEEDLSCPAVATLTLRVAGETAAFVATVEEETPDDATVALAQVVAHQRRLVERAGDAAIDETGRDLVLAADAFVVDSPGIRPTVLAGYPWFTDWGRDTMIALPGLCLVTGRYAVAREILLTFAGFVSEGMIPNRFPDQGLTPDYNTVDATLWFVHACDQYLKASGGDEAFRERVVPVLAAVVAAHESGTRFGIRVDTRDGLLRAGGAGLQLTWMDAKIGDQVVTPRTGKPVEINALWVNALGVGAEWTGDVSLRDRAERAATSFCAAFVRPDGRGLYDVVADDGTPDASVRPNQIIAAALLRSPLTDEQVRAVVDTVRDELLTPSGLRTLAPSDPAYHGRYGGAMAERDAAYHQGTVWPWLLGPYVDAHRRAYPGDEATVGELLAPLEAHLRDYGVGGIAEVFEGDAPHRPDGCPWQAWSVAEVLRTRRRAVGP